MRWLLSIGAALIALATYIYVPSSSWDELRNRLTGVQNPANFDICFAKGYPGATGRYVDYQPVSCKNKTPILLDTPDHKTIGADFGELRFKDLDEDKIAEIIVETNSSSLDCHYPERYVYAIQTSPSLVLVQREYKKFDSQNCY